MFLPNLNRLIASSLRPGEHLQQTLHKWTVMAINILIGVVINRTLEDLKLRIFKQMKIHSCNSSVYQLTLAVNTCLYYWIKLFSNACKAV